MSRLVLMMITFALGSTVLIQGLNKKVVAGEGASAVNLSRVMPQKAYLVFTKERWGCLGGQTIIADVARNLTAHEGNPVLLTEVKNPEDVDDRLELFIYFFSEQVNGLPGYYVLRLGVAGPEARIPGTLQLAEAALVNDGEGVRFLLNIKTVGQLKSDLLYAGDTRLAFGMFTCPQARRYEAHQMNFLQTYPIWTELSSSANKFDGHWDKVTIRLEEFMLNEAEAVAGCYSLLNALENYFSVSSDALFLWDQYLLTPQNINLLASSLEQGRNLRFHVNIELQDRQGITEIPRDHTPFAPQLRQLIAARDAHEKIIGGSVLIAVEKLEPR